MHKNESIRQHVTNQLVEAIESGTLPWRRQFATDPNAGLSSSLSTGKQYSGINQLLLQLSSFKNGFQSKHWGTYKAISFAGGQVRRGEKATRICLFNPITKKSTDANGDEKTDRFFIFKQFAVFNVEQCNGLDEFQVGYACSQKPFDGCEYAESIIEATGANIEYGGNQPCYIPALDQIKMPNRHQFKSSEAFYETSFHELAHWTHHLSRLNPKKRPDGESYAFEELVAEIAACYLMAECKLELDTGNSAAYLSHWLNALKSDSRFLFQATALASKSADFILRFSNAPTEVNDDQAIPF